jgi:hypothetical protein
MFGMWRSKKGGSMSEFWKEFFENEDGVGVIEIVLVLVVLIGLVLIFKGNIGKLLNNIFKEINKKSKEVYT